MKGSSPPTKQLLDFFDFTDTFSIGDNDNAD